MLGELADVVTRRVVLADNVVVPRVVAVLDGASQFRRVVPHELGEVARGLGEARVGVVVLVDLVVPGVHGAEDGVADGEVLAVGPLRVREYAGAVVVRGVVLCVSGQGVGPGERACVDVQGAQAVVLGEDGRLVGRAQRVRRVVSGGCADVKGKAQ